MLKMSKRHCWLKYKLGLNPWYKGSYEYENYKQNKKLLKRTFKESAIFVVTTSSLSACLIELVWSVVDVLTYNPDQALVRMGAAATLGLVASGLHMPNKNGNYEL